MVHPLDIQVIRVIESNVQTHINSGHSKFHTLTPNMINTPILTNVFEKTIELVLST